MDLYEADVQCPHCWQAQTILIDPSDDHAELIEDCQICCKPIEIEAAFNEFDLKWIKIQESWA